MKLFVNPHQQRLAALIPFSLSCDGEKKIMGKKRQRTTLTKHGWPFSHV
jgi:hypothetical protein